MSILQSDILQRPAQYWIEQGADDPSLRWEFIFRGKEIDRHLGISSSSVLVSALNDDLYSANTLEELKMGKKMGMPK